MKINRESLKMVNQLYGRKNLETIIKKQNSDTRTLLKF